jgi:pilus assembly protein CpaB
MALRLPRLRINKLWLLLGAALTLGVAAAFLSVNYLKGREQRMAEELARKAKGGPTIAVVVPTRELALGAMIDQKVVAAREVVADLLYDDAVTADQFEKVAGKRLLKPVLPGRPLRFSDVQDDRAKDLSTALEPGLRALTFDIDETNSFAQMLRPGNFVDLYLIAQDPGAPSPASQEVRALLPKVKVMATGQTVRGSPEAAPQDPMAQQGRQQSAYTNITVEVTPAQAARIALAQQVGKIRAVLRNPEDEKASGFAKLATPSLFRDGNEPSVEYIVGGKSGGTGATAPISINMPNLSIPGMSAGAPGGSPGASFSPGQSAAFSGQPAALGASVPSVPTGAR